MGTVLVLVLAVLLLPTIIRMFAGLESKLDEHIEDSKRRRRHGRA